MIAASRHSLQRWLQLHCESCTDVAGGVVVLLLPGQELAQGVAEWPHAGLLTHALTSAAQAAVKRERLVVVAPAIVQKEAGHNRVIALPICEGSVTLGAVALAVQAKDSAALDVLVKHLGQACLDIAAGLSQSDPKALLASTESAANAGEGSGWGESAVVLAMQSALLEHATLAQGAFAMVTHLAHELGCERVSLGASRHQGLEVVAISGSTDFKRQQQLVQWMAAAMQEAVDQRAAIFFPANPTDPARIVLAHAELRAQVGTALATFPLVHGGQVCGALLVECRADTRLDKGLVHLCETITSAIGGLVALRQQVDRPWHEQVVAWCRAGWHRLMAKEDPWSKVVAGSVALLLVGVLTVPVSYRVGAPVRVEGAQQRVVAAPLDGYIRRSLVRPGDVVTQGALLVEMADQDLVLERRKWESNLAQSENGFATALARGDRAQFIINQGKASEAQAQLDLVRQQLARTRLLSPIDGVVIKGDLSQALGAPVQRGDVLLTLSPKNQHRLIIEVDERDIATLSAGMSGVIALSAMPGESLPMVIERITPVATVADGRNAFEVEAKLTTDTSVLRYGMQGVAKIDVGRRPLAWIWTHRAWDWVRMTAWSWIN